MFIKSFRVGPVVTNCYILGDESTKQAAIIDPGANGDALVRKVIGEGYEPTMILLTHGHFDHVGGVESAVNLLRSMEREVPVYIHAADYPTSPTGFSMDVSLSGIPGIRYYKEGDTVALGALTIKVIETPGHTKGGVCLVVEDAIFSGDTLFAGSCGRTDFPASSPSDMMKSLKKLSLIKGDYRVYPGHEAPTSLDYERKTNPYMTYAMRQ